MSSNPLNVANLCVQAGAGAGKTTHLTSQVLQVASDFKAAHGYWPRIVVTTFTRKATQELRERLLLRSLDRDEGLVDFVRSSHLLTVSTMHGLMDLFLRSQGMRMGLSPEFRIISQGQGLKIKKRCLRKILRDNSEFASLMGEMKFSSILTHLTSLRSLGASGDEWKPFTRASFLEMSNRRAELVLEKVKKIIEVLEIHSLRTEWAEFLDHLRSLVVSFRNNSWDLFHQGLADWICGLQKPRKKKGDPEDVISITSDFAGLKKEISKLSEDIYAPAYWNELEKNYQLMSGLLRVYEAELENTFLSTSEIPLEDLEIVASRLLSSHPDSGENFGSRWDYWLIDEYQDTSPSQVKIIEAWISNKPLYVVGDPQQSIYLFRGARREVFFEMWEKMKISGSTHSLQTNYRSDPDLLSFINWTVHKMGTSFVPMDPRGVPEKKDWVVSFLPSEDEDQEWLRIKGELFELLAQTGVRLDQICFLARTKRELDRLGRRLQEVRLPYEIHSGANFFSRREVLDVLAALKFILNPWDDINAVNFCRSPWIGFSDQELHDALQGCKSNVWDRLRSVSSTSPAVMEMETLLLERESKDVVQIIFDFCEKKMVFDSCRFLDPSGAREANLFKIFHQLRARLVSSGANLMEIFEGVESVDPDREGEEQEAISTLEPNRIHLMTYHAAKGLQFEYVFLPHLHREFRIDTWWRFTGHEGRKEWGFRKDYKDSDKELAHPGELDWSGLSRTRQHEEGWRVFYVGLTRAAKKVYLSWQKKVKTPSPAELFSSLNEDDFQNEHFIAKFPRAVGSEDHLSTLKWTPEDVGSGEAPKSQHLFPWSQSLVGDVGPKVRTSVSRELGEGGAPKNLHQWRKGLEASLQGQRAHRLFELLKISSQGEMDEYLKLWFPDDLERVLSAIKYVRDSQEPKISEIMEAGRAEWSFLVPWRGRVLEGQIDLFGRDGKGRFWVVDYKTGSSKFSDKAFKQLAIYSEALIAAKQVESGEPLYLCALYPFEGVSLTKEFSPLGGEL